MDAPKCQKIPSCGKRHYGDCASASSQVPRAKKPARKKKFKKVRDVALESHKKYMNQPGKVLGVEEMLDILEPSKPAAETLPDLMHEIIARLESLEARVLELENCKKYMREYQRDWRAKEKGDG